jgi:hypothetical protein
MAMMGGSTIWAIRMFQVGVSLDLVEVAILMFPFIPTSPPDPATPGLWLISLEQYLLLVSQMT